MQVQRLTVPLTTDSSGAATGYTDTVTGRVLSIHYTKTDFANGSTMTVSSEATGETIWTEANVNASAVRRPRLPTHGSDGSAALYAATGTAVNDYAAVANDRIKIVIANGGNVKTGSFDVVIG